MYTIDDLKQLFRDIREEWDTAERDVKKAEKVCGNEAVISSITELRYGGRRIVDALNALADGCSETDIVRYLDEAKFNCHRARHDAIDAATLIMTDEINVIRKKLGVKALLTVCPDYTRFWTELREVEEKIEGSRQDRNDRDGIYATISEIDFPKLASEYRSVIDNEDAIREIAKKDRLIIAFGWAGIFFGIASLAALALTIYLNWSALTESWNSDSGATQAEQTEELPNSETE